MECGGLPPLLQLKVSPPLRDMIAVWFLYLGLSAARLPSPSPCVIPTRVTALAVARLRDLLFAVYLPDSLFATLH
jgi:hypothetical protein